MNLSSEKLYLIISIFFFIFLGPEIDTVKNCIYNGLCVVEQKDVFATMCWMSMHPFLG
jgi:hypothetical protein